MKLSRTFGRVLVLTIGLGIAFSPVLSSNAWCQEAGVDNSRWLARRNALLKDPAVLKFYSFEEKSGSTIHNLVNKELWGDMTVATNPAYMEDHPSKFPRDFPTWTTGRWPQKSALAIGVAPQSVYGSRFYQAKDNRFSIEMWIRPYWEKGDKTLTDFVYQDDTISSGWKITGGTSYTMFQIARPAGKEVGQGGVSVFGSALSGYVWHHVVAVLDAKTVSLYIDGKLVNTKEFDGIYTMPKVSDRMAKTPELDTGGMVVGSRLAPNNVNEPVKPTRLFDLDELVVWGKALTADEVAAAYVAGSPTATAEVQVAQRKQELEREAQLKSVALTIPTASFGYFTVGKPFTASAIVPPEAKLTGPLRATFTLKDAKKATVFEIQKNGVVGANSLNLTTPITLSRAGAYSLDIALRDANGAVLRQQRYELAGIVALPPISEIPISSPLAGHDIVNSHPAELMTGARIDRMISPFTRIMPDGSYDWSVPDRYVDAARKSGLDILYTIHPPFNMPRSSPQELAREPERWAKWVRDLVTHYKGKVRYWEIWNEPNAIPGFTAPDYVVLLKSAAAVIREVDPSATIVGGGGVYFIPQWTEGVLAAGGGPYMDVLSVHNYVGTSPLTYRNRYHKVEQAKALMKKYIDRQIPLWATEGGIHQPARIDGRPMTDDELLKLYGTRANKTDGWPNANVHAIMMTTEHRSTCWNVQSILVDLADGVEKYFTLMGAGTFYPFKTDSEGLPTEKGVAYAAMASVLTTSKSFGWLPLSNSKAAAIAITDQNGKRTVALFSDQPLEFTFNVPNGKQFVGMDYLGNPLQWQSKDGGITVRTGDEPIYIFDVPQDFAERRLLASNQFPKQVSPLKMVSGILNVSNPTNSPLQATLEGTSTAGKVNVNPQISIPAGNTIQVPFQFESDNSLRGTKTLRFILKSGARSLSQLEIPFYAEGPAKAVALVTAPITLDDADTNWTAIKPLTANQANNVVIGKPDVGFANTNVWQGAEDCSFTVKTAWRTNDGVYVQIDVKDDKFYPTPKGNNQPWLWDGLELFVDTRPANKRSAGVSAGAQQITVVPEGGTTVAPCKVTNLAGNSATVDVVFIGRKTEQGYVLTGKISPKAGSGWELKAGTRFGLDFAIDDNDDGVKRKVQMALHGTLNNATDTSGWGEYELMPPM